MRNVFLRLLILVAGFGMLMPNMASAAPCPVSSANQTVWVSNVEARAPNLTTYSNPSGPSAYSDFTNPCIPFDHNIPNLNLGVDVSAAGNYLGVWIDANDNGVFETSENLNPWLTNVSPMSGTGVNFGISSSLTGNLAVRIILSPNPITGPCDNIANGEIEDYILCFACNPVSADQSRWISNVRLFDFVNGWTFANPSGASSYTDYTSQTITVNNTPAQVNVSVTQGGGFIAAWMDLNDNGTFEANEELTNGPDTGNPGSSIAMSGGILTGVTGCHTMRIIYSSAPITGPCDGIPSGEIEDYTVCFPCNAQSQSQDRWISNVRLFDFTNGWTFANPSGPSAYSDFTGQTITVLTTPAQVNVSVTQGGGFIGAWMDLNDNGIYEANEQLTNGPDTGNPGKTIAMSGGILTGVTGCHTMRIIYSSNPITGPCDDVASGEVEDYTVCFPCNAQSQDQDRWISNVRLFDFTNGWTFANPTGPSAYSDFTGMTINVLTTPAQVNVSVTQGGGFIGAWMDLNDNGIYEANEELTNGPDTGNPGKTIAMSGGILTGVTGCHTMRIIYSSNPITGPCDDVASGEVEDYTVCFPCNAQSQDQDRWISNVRLFDFVNGWTFANPSGPSAYSDFTGQTIVVTNTPAQVNVSVTQGGGFIGAWMDLNDNGIYEANEELTNGPDTGNPGSSISMSGGILTGVTGCHTMRIIYSSNPITGPCDDIASGEVEDYTVCFPCTPRSEDQSIWISNVRVFDWSVGWIYQNPTGASAYSDYTNPAITLASGQAQMNITATLGGQYFGVWVDVNANGIFEANEMLYNGQDTGNPGIAVVLSGGILTGIEGCHNVRIIYSAHPVTGPCDDIKMGEIEDYTVCWGKEGKGDDGPKRKQAFSELMGELQVNVYPQPAADMTNLQIEMPAQAMVSVNITDMQGRTVARILDQESLTAGTHVVPMNVSNLGQGVYFVSVKTAAGTKTAKLVVL